MTSAMEGPPGRIAEAACAGAREAALAAGPGLDEAGVTLSVTHEGGAGEPVTVEVT